MTEGTVYAADTTPVVMLQVTCLSKDISYQDSKEGTSESHIHRENRLKSEERTNKIDDGVHNVPVTGFKLWRRHEVS